MQEHPRSGRRTTGPASRGEGGFSYAHHHTTPPGGRRDRRGADDAASPPPSHPPPPPRPRPAPYCGITWGSLAKATSPGQLWTGKVTAARTGQHACFDRVVFDIAKGSGKLGYNVRYVNTLTGPGSGLPGLAQRRRQDPDHHQRAVDSRHQHEELLRLADLPSAEEHRQLRGLHRLRARRPRPAADAGVHAHQRRRRPAVSSSTSPTAGRAKEQFVEPSEERKSRLVPRPERNLLSRWCLRLRNGRSRPS